MTGQFATVPKYDDEGICPSLKQKSSFQKRTTLDYAEIARSGPKSIIFNFEGHSKLFIR